jgi:Domain of unknown function (DUF4272)
MMSQGTDRSKAQIERANRSINELHFYQVPICGGTHPDREAFPQETGNRPLLIPDDDRVSLRDSAEVVKRLLVLYAVVLKAEDVSHQEMLGLMAEAHLWNSVSPVEKRFLHQDYPDPAECSKMEWRLECIWVLLWALGYIQELDWPSDMCDVQRLVQILKPHEANPLKFIATAKLRSKKEILDATDLTARIHWAIRDAYINNKPIPCNLDWSSNDDMLPATKCAATGVVEERHRTLKWLIRLGNADWDDVDTST